MFFVGDHDRVGGLDNDHVLDADRGHQSVLRPDVRAFAVHGEYVALQDVSVTVLGGDFPVCRPGTDIAPAGIDRNDRGVVRLFEESVIDGVARAVRKSFLVKAQEIQVLLCLFDGFFTAAHHFRGMQV